MFIFLQTESVDINSEADERMNESTPSSPASDIAANGSFYCNDGFLNYIFFWTCYVALYKLN